jgi:hypothetical protein
MGESAVGGELGGVNVNPFSRMVVMRVLRSSSICVDTIWLASAAKEIS